MGVVYRAKQLSLKRTVAIKILRSELAANRSFTERFHREAQIAAQLSSNRIVQAIDTGCSHGQYYFVMEFVEGSTVQDLLDQGRTFDEKNTLEIGIQIAEALDHANQQGLVHRDIKPDNIIITQQGTAKVADMGLARPTKDDKGWSKIESGKVVGTPYYISPEQVNGAPDIDSRADIYSLGATMYHMATGTVPFPGNSVGEVMRAHLNNSLTPPDHINQELSAGFGEVVETMMYKVRNQRYPGPADLLIDLRRIKNGKPPLLARTPLSTSLLGSLEESTPSDDVTNLQAQLKNRTMLVILITSALGGSLLANILQLLFR